MRPVGARRTRGGGKIAGRQEDTSPNARVRKCCALCLGAVDWHNCGRVLSVWEFGWGLVSVHFLTLYNIVDIGGPSIILI